MYYVAHRLFALHDRALGALVASELARQVGPEHVFLPFCDTDEEAMVAHCKGRTLFELDSQRLQTLTGMIAVLHGPSLDDGVCMEIGYARRLGVPVVALSTDFQTYGMHETGPEIEFPDPLLDVLVTRVVRVSRLAPPAKRPTTDRFRAFTDRNLAPLRPAARSAVETLLAHAPTPPHRHPSTISERNTTLQAFIEPSPYHQLPSWAAVTTLLTAQGWDVHTARRWEMPPRASRVDVLARARCDWETLEQSSLLITDVNGPEAPPGAAVLIGASAAAGQKVFAAYEDRSFTFAPGREANFRNLMIQYAITERFRRVDDLPSLLERR